MMNFVSMGKLLAIARKEKHISQELAAEWADVSIATIRNIEHGDTFPRMETIFALWDIYGLPRDDIWDYFSRSNFVNEEMKKHGIGEHEKDSELTAV